MLYLISMGLIDEKDMSLRALESARKCRLLYAEFYTNKTAATPASLSKLVGKKVRELQREGMEEGAGDIIEESKKKDIGVFVPGDVLSATTHLMMLAEARKAGAKVKIVHGSSIFTAVAETGLQLYKFGRTVTLTDPFLQSTKRAIENNYRSRLHTKELKGKIPAAIAIPGDLHFTEEEFLKTLK
jgi:diphthine synthase